MIDTFTREAIYVAEGEGRSLPILSESDLDWLIENRAAALPNQDLQTPEAFAEAIRENRPWTLEEIIQTSNDSGPTAKLYVKAVESRALPRWWAKHPAQLMDLGFRHPPLLGELLELDGFRESLSRECLAEAESKGTDRAHAIRDSSTLEVLDLASFQNIDKKRAQKWLAAAGATSAEVSRWLEPMSVSKLADVIQNRSWPKLEGQKIDAGFKKRWVKAWHSAGWPPDQLREYAYMAHSTWPGLPFYRWWRQKPWPDSLATDVIAGHQFYEDRRQLASKLILKGLAVRSPGILDAVLGIEKGPATVTLPRSLVIGMGIAILILVAVLIWLVAR